jgi:hypothetical protein
MSKDTTAILKRRAELIKELTEEPSIRTGVRSGLSIFEPPQPCLSPARRLDICLTPAICLSPADPF